MICLRPANVKLLRTLASANDRGADCNVRIGVTMKARRFLVAMLVFAAPWLTAVASAQDAVQGYPNRVIRIIVPFPAGGPTDNLARLLSQKLSTVLAQNVVVENRGGGAGGSVGAKAVATADPDGYTLLMAPGGSLTVGPAVHKNIGYDPFKVFTPVGQLIEILAGHWRAPGLTGQDAGRY